MGIPGVIFGFCVLICSVVLFLLFVLWNVYFDSWNMLYFGYDVTIHIPCIKSKLMTAYVPAK